MNKMFETDVIVVGSGLAGLTAATFLARAGVGVTLFEKSRLLGGRAITETKNGFQFNLGPHALYRSGAAARMFRELGLELRGGVPPTSGGFAIDRGAKHTLPSGAFSLFTTGLFGLPAKLEAARWLANIAKIDTHAIRHLSVREWLNHEIRHPDLRRFLQAFFRISTYANDPERQSAGAAVAQFQMAVAKNVLYLDNGWQTLIQGLRAAAQTAGATILTEKRVTQIECDVCVRGVRLSDGTFCRASSVIIAASPEEACDLVENGGETTLHRWAQQAIPVKAACLDVALTRLPDSRVTFAMGIDQPLYFSVHSAVAKLAANGGVVLHAMKYLGATASDDPKTVERELEMLLDLVQPGWREFVVHTRFLPALTVTHGLATAERGGISGQPGPAVPGIPGLYVAGDWVGQEGLLADASVASGKTAVQLVLNQNLPAAKAKSMTKSV